MPLTAHLLRMPTFILFILIAGVSTSFALTGLFVVRRCVQKEILKSHNDIAGFVFATLGVTYAVILAFVAITIWEQMSHAKERAQLESDAAIAFYYNVRLIDQPAISGPIIDQLATYVDMVIEQEYPAMQVFRQDMQTRDEFNKLWSKIMLLNPSDDKEIVIYDHLLTSLTQIAEFRAMRYHDMNDQVPAALWLTIVLGGIITIGFTWLFGSEDIRVHTIISCSLSLLIGLVVFVIIILDHPYTGEVRIEPEGYEMLSTMLR